MNRQFKVGAPLFVGALMVATLVRASDGVDRPKGPISLGVQRAAIVDGQLVADVLVKNTGAVRHEVEVRMTLGVYGEADAWSRRVSETPTLNAALRKDETAELAVDWPIFVPAGSYELTTWIRFDDTSGQVVQFTHDETIEVTEAAPLSRISAVAPSGSWIEDVESEATAGAFVRADLVARVPQTEPGSSVQLDLIEADASTTWWERRAVITDVTEVTAAPEGASSSDDVARFDTLLIAPPGRYEVRLHLLDSTGVEQDQVLVAGELTVDETDPSIRRIGRTAGPLVVTAVEYPATWSEAADATVVVEVENLSTDVVTGELWWHLSAPGVFEPWNAADVSSETVRRTFQPGKRQSVRLGVDGDTLIGDPYELSVWVHAETGAEDPGGYISRYSTWEDDAHSDGVLGNQLVAIEAGPNNA
jgi:uncharacterized lipoprotein YbaY